MHWDVKCREKGQKGAEGKNSAVKGRKIVVKRKGNIR